MTRFLSALLLGPLALALMLVHPATFLVVVIPAFLLAIYEWTGIVRALPRRKIPIAALGFLYISVSFYTFVMMRLPEGGWMTILFLLLAVWASDTGGYVFGKAYGGPKWVPSISPNKTWAGLGGAMIGAAIIYQIFGLAPAFQDPYYAVTYFENHLWVQMLLGGLILGFVCQIGDLFISMFKRRAGLKDTGNVIPGHGGILDRIDSLMAASLFIYIAMRVMG